MAISIEWVFLCESIDFGPDGEVVSLHRIIRPHSGFGARKFPFTIEPRFFLGVRGKPFEEFIANTTVIEGSAPAHISPDVPGSLGSSGFAELVIDCAMMEFREPGTFTFGLMLNGEVVFSTKAPLERMI